MKNARNEARVEANLHTKTSKALGTIEQKIQELTTKVTAKEGERRSSEAGLKNAQDQAEKRRKKLHYAEIKLVIARQQAVDLKVELEKAKEIARAAKEATKASKQKSYILGV